MYGNLVLLIFLSILISINSQRENERDLPPETYQTDRTAKTSIDGQFARGRCPPRFYQSGEECLFFLTDGRGYSWNDAERICSGRIARLVEQQQSSATGNQPNLTPTKGVRQIVLNTPEKTELFRAFIQEYNEDNFAVRLPSDYNTLQRCSDGKDDKWPNYCTNSQSSNASTCYETKSNGANDVCLGRVECNQRYLRVACEFTLPGSAEITNSKFRNCPTKPGGFLAFRRRLPTWAWILIGVGSGLLLIIILAVIITRVCKSKNNSSPKKKSLPEPRAEITKTRVKPEDPAVEPMINRTTQSDTGYLQPRSSDRVLPSTRDNTENA